MFTSTAKLLQALLLVFEQRNLAQKPPLKIVSKVRPVVFIL
jgi:hypothetical protein